MTHKYERQCWSCGSKDMEPDAQGVRCRSCGATWNALPQPGGDALIEARDYTLSPKGSRAAKSGSPSPGVRRKASVARTKKV